MTGGGGDGTDTGAGRLCGDDVGGTNEGGCGGTDEGGCGEGVGVGVRDAFLREGGASDLLARGSPEDG